MATLTIEIVSIQVFEETMCEGHYDKLLKQALGLRERETLSIVGAGGKTTFMFLLGRVLEASGSRVITTTTTKIFPPAPGETPFLSLGERVEAILAHLNEYRHVTVVSERVAHGKFQGILPEQADALWNSGAIDYLIIEADGAAHRSLKAPESYEPVIPACTGIVVALLGADAFGASLTEEKVFRSDIFSQLTGLPLGSPVSHEAISTVITHKDGIVRGAPESARIVPFVNKIDLDGALEEGRRFARALLKREDPRVDRVVLGQLRHDPPVVEVIFPE